jgi:hypothetical protein
MVSRFIGYSQVVTAITYNTSNFSLYKTSLLTSSPDFFLRLLSLSLMLRPKVSRSVYLRIKHRSAVCYQIFITVRQLRVCLSGAPSLTRGRVCCLQLVLGLASTVLLGSESRGNRDNILLSQIRDFPFRRLLRLAGLRWRYSTSYSSNFVFSLHNPSAGRICNTFLKS